MNLQNYYYYFQSALTPRFCDELIKYGISQQEQLALTGGQTDKVNKGKPLDDKDIIDLKKKRDSNIVWLNDRWIYKEIQPFIHQANRLAGWDFQWDFSESCQFTKYKLNQFYDWHCDSWETPYANPDNKDTNGKIRKLSVTCSLSDPKDYEGGEFEISSPNPKPEKHINTKFNDKFTLGTVISFPSFVWHKVNPVTSGTRKVLVGWSVGPQFI